MGNNQADAACGALLHQSITTERLRYMMEDDSGSKLPEYIQELEGDMKEEALWRLSGRWFTWGEGRCWICPSLQQPHTFEDGAEDDPTIVREDWQMSLQEAQKADEKALGEYMGNQKAEKLGAEMTGGRQDVGKARPLVHLWSRTRKLERPKDFRAAYKRALGIQH